MKIAELKILQNITNSELISLLGNLNETLEVDFKDTKGKLITFDIAPLFRQQNQLATVFKKTFDFADYQLNKNDIMVLIFPNQNHFILKANKLIDENDNTQDISAHKLLLNVITNTGNVVGKIIDKKEFIIDISEDIPQQIKTDLKAVNLDLLGTKWNDFIINGKAKIEFQQIDNKTVFVGNKIDGFLTN